jgi:hypothetical protein
MVKVEACIRAAVALLAGVQALATRQVLSARQDCDNCTVQDGDSCDSIASDVGCNIMDLLGTNPPLIAEGCDNLQTGQVHHLFIFFDVRNNNTHVSAALSPCGGRIH